MKHPERYLAKRIDTPGRAQYFTDQVYAGESGTWDAIRADQRARFPASPAYRVYFGDLHGHSCLSDGKPTPDEYYTTLRDKAGLDFGALTDHDHGGVGKPELWCSGKWKQLTAAAEKYNQPGRFTAILGYERDSYPWYNNLVIYFASDDGVPLRGTRDGECTREELHRWLAREDLLLVPHDTNFLSAGCDFLSMDTDDMTPLIQIYSRDSCTEYFGNPLHTGDDCEGGHWRDALEKGARMGVIGASDDHAGTPGLTVESLGYPRMYPGLTGVWAEDNTRESIFSALKARRCYGFMGGRITLDFRINGHYMGEEFTDAGDRAVWFRIDADAPVESVTVIKNGRDYLILRSKTEALWYDYRSGARAERETDYYYIRVKLADGRAAWSSPIWIRS